MSGSVFVNLLIFLLHYWLGKILKLQVLTNSFSVQKKVPISFFFEICHLFSKESFFFTLFFAFLNNLVLSLLYFLNIRIFF